MALSVRCTECGYRFKVPNEYAGKRGLCPQCKTLLLVPAPTGQEGLGTTPQVASRGAIGGGGATELKGTAPAGQTAVPPPRSVVPSARSLDPASSALPRITTDNLSAGTRRSSTNASPPVARRSGVPIGLWISLAAAAILLVAVMVWGLARDEQARSYRGPVAGSQRRLPVVARSSPESARTKRSTSASSVDMAREPDSPPSTSNLSNFSDLQRVIVASTLEEVKRAVVKVEVPIDGGAKVESGSGFFVDGRGWIATNDHVIKNISSAARVRLADGMVCEIEGIIAKVPDRDLALLKLRERPYQVTVLDIRRSDVAKLGEQVYAFGHPYNADFSLSKGIVSRVLNTAELNEGARQMLRTTIQTPDNVVWIQHDAKISPGNSGGPLIDDQGRVLGVNSFVHLQAEFGYASDVRYLREMVQGAEDKAPPLPPAGNVAQSQDFSQLQQIDIDPKTLNELFTKAERFHFQPDNDDQYATLTSLAAALTMAKHVEHHRGNVPAAVAAAASRMADALAARLRAIDFRAEQYEAVNRFARNIPEECGQGVFAFGTVVGQSPNALVLQVDEGGKNLLVQVGPELAKADPMSRWLVLGVYSNQVVQVQRAEGGDSRPMRILTMYYMLKT